MKREHALKHRNSGTHGVVEATPCMGFTGKFKNATAGSKPSD
jgi:hypothetical protein